MLISIITPTSNSEITIASCIKSVKKQSFKDYEHIFIDNLSDDKTIKIIKKFSKLNSNIYTEKDNGIFDAMNTGVKKAKGEYLLFLNSDDEIINSNFLLNISKLLKKNKYDIIYSNIIYKKNILGIKRKYISGKFNKNYGWHIPHPGSVIKKKFFKSKKSFSRKYKISGDFDFFIKAQLDKKLNIYYYNNFTVLMSLGGASSGFKNIIKSNIECYDSLKKNKIKHPLYFIFKKLIFKLSQLF